MKKTHELDMTEGAILPKLLQFSVPIMLMNILQQMFNAADTVIVGKFSGGEAMAAVGSTAFFLGFLLCLFCGICNGTGILCARYYGKRDTKKLTECLYTSLSFSLLLSVPLTVGGVLSAPVIPRLLKVDPTLQEMTATYLRLFFLGIPADMITNFGGSGIRATGNSQLPTLFVAIGGLLNLILNCVFVIGFGMDVDGVALATVLSKYLAAALTTHFLLTTEDSCRLELKKLRFYKGHLFPVLQLGVPGAISGCLPSFTTMTMQASINSFGYFATAGGTAASSILNFAYLPLNAVTAGVSCFTGQNLGAGKHRRVPQLIVRCVTLSMSICLLFSGCFYFFGEDLLSLYISRTDPDRDAIIAQGMINLLYVGVPIFFYGLYTALCGILGGFGKTTLSMLISFIGFFAFRMVWISILFPRLPNPEIKYLYMCLPAGMLLAAVMTAVAILVVYKRYDRRSQLRTARQ